MRRKRIRKRKLRRFRNRFADWGRAFATVCGMAYDRAFSEGSVQMALARGPTY